MKKTLLLIALTGIAGVSLCQQKKQGSATRGIRQQIAQLTHRRDSLRTACDHSDKELRELSDQLTQAEAERKAAKKTGSGASPAKIDSLQHRVSALEGKKQACGHQFDRNLEELDNVVGQLNKANEQLAKAQQHP